MSRVAACEPLSSASAFSAAPARGLSLPRFLLKFSLASPSCRDFFPGLGELGFVAQ